ncbi:hypothetical protein [Polaribacter uvawellassae]|uniref:hypothetical protein n=1 Tax=Polaribacter uvawellassae TaxID=3133495 RepID=UPI00321BAE83
MNFINRIKWIFKKPEYYSFDDFNIDNYELKFQFLSDEILMDISKELRKRFNPDNLEFALIEFKDIISQEINDSNEYREENNCSITYFFHEDFFESNNLLFLSQCISSNNQEIGNVTSNIISFEKKENFLVVNNLI